MKQLRGRNISLIKVTWDGRKSKWNWFLSFLW